MQRFLYESQPPSDRQLSRSLQAQLISARPLTVSNLGRYYLGPIPGGERGRAARPHG